MNHSNKVGMVTVCALAHAKLLPESELRKYGVTEHPQGGVIIPYHDESGQCVVEKRRTALVAKEGSFWPFGTPLRPYGENRIHHARKQARLFLVEGESDCWAMWHHKLPCLGMPGAASARCLTHEHIVGIQDLYILQEPDQGGTIFVAGVTKRLQDLGFTGRIRSFRLLDGIKDAADLHCKNPINFVQLIEQALSSNSEVPAVEPPPTANAARKPTTDPVVAKAGQTLASQPTPRIIRLSAVHGEPVEWLWAGRLPLGKLTVIDGDPSLGKSSLVLDIAARLSRGAAMPDDERDNRQPSGVVLLSAEDGLADTLYPRLEAAGADLRRIVSLSCVDIGSQSRPIELPQDLDAVEEAIVTADARLVIIDPLMAFLGGDYSANSDQNVRRALHPLTLLAERKGVAMLIVRHLNKNEKSKTALYRGGGSIGIIGAARCGLLVAADPDDNDKRVLAVVKNNLAPRAQALSFSVASASNGASCIIWNGARAVDADALLTSQDADEPHQLTEAASFLRELLKDGEIAASTAFAEAIINGISERSLRRAKVKLGVLSRRHGFAGEWRWSLPQPPAPHLPASA